MDLLYVAPQTEGEESVIKEIEKADVTVAPQEDNAPAPNPNPENGPINPEDAGDLDAEAKEGADSLSNNKKKIITEQKGKEAETEAQQQPDSSPWSFWIMIVAMIAIMYFFMWRPERKRRKQMEEFRNGLKKGDKVITAGGIYGTVKEVNENSLLIEVDGNITLRVDKGMVVGDPSNGTAR
jgi:preprotein translocase subunit YajC